MKIAKIASRLMAVAAGLLAAQVAVAQAAAGSTGQCKDGTYSTAASKQGACRGHQGVKDWWAAAPAAGAKAATAAAPATAAKPATAPAPAAAAKSDTAAAPAAKSVTAAAPGGGPGMVWVNTSTKVYHCPGTQFYGKTKEGKYMSEA